MAEGIGDCGGMDRGLKEVSMGLKEKRIGSMVYLNGLDSCKKQDAWVWRLLPEELTQERAK